jgi:hypothetical protein
MMKKFLLVILAYVFSWLTFSQEKTTPKIEKNQISFYATDAINGLYTLSYERAFGKHMSVNFGVGYKTEEGLIVLSGIDTDQLKTNNITYSGYKIVPEFRYYLNESVNGAMLSGFYFGAYLKYSDFKSDLIGTFINSEGESFDIAYQADIAITSVGLMVGYKLPIAKHFFVDFLIAGPGSGSYKFNLDNTIPPPDEFYDVLNQALENYSIFDLINADFQFNNRNLRSNFSVFSFRYGISVGYSF